MAVATARSIIVGNKEHACDGGYCAGVAMDWIRSMILSRAEPSAENATYRYGQLSGRLPEDDVFAQDAEAFADAPAVRRNAWEMPGTR